MKTNSIRQISLWIALSVFAVFGMNACGDDSSKSDKDQSKECTEAKITECTNAGKVCKEGECVKEETDQCTQEKIAECALTNRNCEKGKCVPKADPCTQEKIDECQADGKVCERGECVEPNDDPCTQEIIAECERTGTVCDSGICVDPNDHLCSQQLIAECERDGRVCERGACVDQNNDDPCTPEKIAECTSQNRVCDDGQCVKQPVLTVTPENTIPLVAYNLSTNEEDMNIPASYPFCFKLDTAPTSNVNLTFEKMGPNKDYVGMTPETLTLNAENYNADTNCVTVSDLLDGSPVQIQSPKTVQIEATTMSDQSLFTGLHADIIVELKDSYEYDLQLSQTEIELNEEDQPDFDIDVRLLAAPEDENKYVKVNHSISCGDRSNITIEYKGINKYHSEDSVNNVYTKTNADVHWSQFKSFKFKLRSNATINQPSETCTITFATETEDPNFKDITKDVTVTIIDDAH